MPNEDMTADPKQPAQPRDLPPSAARTTAVKGGKKKPAVLDTSAVAGEAVEPKFRDI